MRRSIHLTRRIRVAAATLLLIQSAFLPAQIAERPNAQTSRKIGIVIVEGGTPGQPISTSLVTDFEPLQSVQGLKVVPFTVDSTIAVEDLVVETGDGKLQEGDQPVLANIPVSGSALTYRVFRKDRPNEPIATPLVPLDVTTQSEPLPTEYIAPAIPENGVLQIRGPITGDTTHMHATEDNRPIRILASRPGAVFVDTATATNPGAHEIKLYDANGVELFTLPTYAVRTTAVHPKGILHPGQTAESSFVLSGPESFPADAWGFLEFHVSNETPQIAAVESQQDFVFNRQDFLEGPKTVTVKLLAVHDGVSRLRGQLRVHVHPVSAAADQVQPKTDQGFTAMDQAARGYLRSLGKDPSNWTVTRIPNGGLRYTSPDGTVMDATGQKGQLVMEFVR